MKLAIVTPTVVRATKTESLLRGGSPDPGTLEATVQVLDSELVPIDHIRSTARYRRRVAANLLIEFGACLR